MKRILTMALAWAGGLACVVIPGGSVTAVSGSQPRLEAGPYEFPLSLSPQVDINQFKDAGEQKTADGDYPNQLPELISRRLALGGDWPDQGITQLAPASLPLTNWAVSRRDWVESKSRLEPQWFSSLPSEERGEVDGNKGIMPPAPVIPEPVALLLLGSGLLVLAAFGKKWKRRR